MDEFVYLNCFLQTNIIIFGRSRINEVGKVYLEIPQSKQAKQPTVKENLRSRLSL